MTPVLSLFCIRPAHGSSADRRRPSAAIHRKSLTEDPERCAFERPIAVDRTNEQSIGSRNLHAYSLTFLLRIAFDISGFTFSVGSGLV
jgi:hypothetical protein